ncbi:MAG: AI-2E family transporter [Desulfoprunum sp.]|nr:AI-2E family transporter [Desulfoprunum sp.]
MSRPDQDVSADASPSDTEGHYAPPCNQPHDYSPKQAHFFSFLFLTSALMLGWVLWPFWQLLILAFLLAGVFRPIYKKLSSWMSSWTASLLTCTLIVLLVFIPLYFCIGTLSIEAMNLFQLGKDTDVLLKLQQIIQNNTLMARAHEALAGFGISFDPADMTKILSGASKTAGLFIYNQASAWAANIMSFVLQFCILIIVAFFLLIEMDTLINFIRRLSPLPDEHNMLLMNKFTKIAGVILIGNGLSCILQGTLGGIFFATLGIKTPVLWGVLMGILAFIPILGIGLVLLPAAVILLLNGYIGQAVATLIFYLVLHYSVELLLKPKFVGSHLKMHALLVLLAIFGGMSLFGVLGIVYGPLIVSLFLTLTEMYLNEYSKIEPIGNNGIDYRSEAG